MDKWKECTLGEYVDINPKITLAKHTIGTKVAMECVKPFCKTIPEFVIAEYKGSGAKFSNGDTLMARITPSLENGKTVKVDILKDQEVGFGSTEFIVLRAKEGKTDPDFVYYLAISPEFREVAIQSMTGSTGRQRVPEEVVKQYQFSFPPLVVQQSIAEVLSSLDDKIDLLHRQNKTLEAMAETLFRQWFVEDADERWEEKPLSDFGEIICGKTPSKKIFEYFDGEYPLIKIPDMHGKTFVFSSQDTLTKKGLDSQIKKTLPPKSINVSCIATVGLVTMNAYPSQTNQQINSIIPNDKYRFYLYCEMKDSYDLLQAMASGGTATLNLNKGNFSKIPIKVPDDEILGIFNEKVTPLFDKIFKNQQQIQTLSKLRDTLLPKLMSGEVRVKSNNLSSRRK